MQRTSDVGTMKVSARRGRQAVNLTSELLSQSTNQVWRGQHSHGHVWIPVRVEKGISVQDRVQVWHWAALHGLWAVRGLRNPFDDRPGGLDCGKRCLYGCRGTLYCVLRCLRIRLGRNHWYARSNG